MKRNEGKKIESRILVFSEDGKAWKSNEFSCLVRSCYCQYAKNFTSESRIFFFCYARHREKGPGDERRTLISDDITSQGCLVIGQTRYKKRHRDMDVYFPQ